MKTCPVCKARCFEDMEVCYGCMHRFDGTEPTGDAVPAAALQSAGKDAAQSEGSLPAGGAKVSLVKPGERLATGAGEEAKSSPAGLFRLGARRPQKATAGSPGPSAKEHQAVPLRQETELPGGYKLVITLEPLADA